MDTVQFHYKVTMQRIPTAYNVLSIRIKLADVVPLGIHFINTGMLYIC